MQRCIDGAQHGALPRCPECGGGLLKVAAAILTVAILTLALLTMATLFYSRWSTRSSTVTAGRASSLAPASMTVTPSSAALTPLPARRGFRGSRHSRCLIQAQGRTYGSRPDGVTLTASTVLVNSAVRRTVQLPTGRAPRARSVHIMFRFPFRHTIDCGQQCAARGWRHWRRGRARARRALALMRVMICV